MKHQLYFPARHADQLGWLINFRQQLPALAGRLWPGDEVGEHVSAEQLRDLDWLIYVMGSLMAWLRAVSKAAISAQRALLTGKAEGGREVALPNFQLPPPPSPAVRSGALKRVFLLVREIKSAPGYTEEVGRQLEIVGNLHARRSEVPVFELEVLHRRRHAVVRGKVKLFGHKGVWVECRRGGADWERLGEGPVKGRVVMDKRPLLLPHEPELREYRMRFWNEEGAEGDWSPVVAVTVPA